MLPICVWKGEVQLGGESCWNGARTSSGEVHQPLEGSTVPGPTKGSPFFLSTKQTMVLICRSRVLIREVDKPVFQSRPASSGTQITDVGRKHCFSWVKIFSAVG